MGTVGVSIVSRQQLKMALPAHCLVLLACVGFSLQCNRASVTPVQEEGIRSERLIQLPGTPSGLESEHSSNDLDANIEDLVQMKFGELESLGRSPKQISEAIVKACPKIFQEGSKFYQSVVREQVVARDVDDCAVMCKQATYCRSFAFSTRENIDENCDLSELSTENIDADKEMTEDAKWSVYGIAEDDSCPEEEEQTTTEKQEPKNCNCNGFIDNVGGGECRQQNYGHWWCYVDSENDCADSQKDSAMPVFSRSYKACSTGPCECNTFNLKKFKNQDICMSDLFDDQRFCYVPLESRCADKRSSKRYPSVYWSMKACSEDEDEEEGSGEQATEAPIVDEEGVSYHKTWNFTSSHDQCANYCTNSERCHYMHSKYDTVEGICHLSTKPFYVVTHYHYGHHHLGKK